MNRAEAATPPSALPRTAVGRQAKDTLRLPCDKKCAALAEKTAMQHTLQTDF